MNSEEAQYVKILYQCCKNSVTFSERTQWTSFSLDALICDNMLMKKVVTPNGEKILRITTCKRCAKCLAPQ